MNEKEILCLEYNVFCRVLNHWEEFEKNSLPIVLEKIIQEIDQELAVLEYEE